MFVDTVLSYRRCRGRRTSRLPLFLRSTSSRLCYLHLVQCSSSCRQSFFPEMCKIRLPIIIIITICCQLIGCQDIKFDDHLGEGDNCTLENGVAGICKKLQECPSKLKDVRNGTRTSNSTGRCGFDHSTETVCCPLRPAEVACRVWTTSSSVTAHQDEFPSMVALTYMTYKTDKNATSITYNCGGSLISVEHVLTAAHCVTNIQYMIPVEVRLGNKNLKNNEGVQRIPISNIVIHRKYKRSLGYNDVAILKLEFSVQISPTVMPICLETRSVPLIDITPRTHLVVTGWGLTSLDSEQSDELLKTSSLRIVDNEVCNKSYTEFRRKLPYGITDSMICTTHPNSTGMVQACPGEGGGPLLLCGESGCSLIGFGAFGSICGSFVTPDVYTAVYPFLDWIEEHVWPTLPSAMFPHST